MVEEHWRAFIEVAQTPEIGARLIARFDDPATPYRSAPRPEHAPRFTDYAQLARIKEWSLAAERE